MLHRNAVKFPLSFSCIYLCEKIKLCIDTMTGIKSVERLIYTLYLTVLHKYLSNNSLSISSTIVVL